MSLHSDNWHYETLILILVLVYFTEYDPQYVPIVYPEDNIEPTTSLESEIERIKEQNQLENNPDESNGSDVTEHEEPQPEEKEYQPPTGSEQTDDKDNQIIPQPQDYLTTTTTIRPTKRRPNKQDPICKLPAEPESDVKFDAGYRFGTALDSRIEFADVPSKIKKSYDISLEFKTDKPDGVLFYAADSRHTDFIALYLQDGFVSGSI